MNRSNTNINSAKAYRAIFVLFSLLLFQPGCKESADQDLVAPANKYLPPNYDQVRLKTTTDTLHFLLDDSTFNAIKSFSIIPGGNGNELIAFYDERTISLNVYNLKTQKKINRLSIKEALKGHIPYKTTAYMVNTDNVFVNNNETFYHFNGAGKLRSKIRFVEDPPLAWATFESNLPAVMKDSCLYASVRPYMNDKSLKALKKWKVLYEFDLRNKKATLKYGLPKSLHENLYGSRLLDHSYCVNHHGDFVFSFPADSAIYETNLKDLHVSYSGKSSDQKAIKPMSKEELEKKGSKKYATRDSYGSIYFDPVKKRYLRVVKKGMSETDYQNKKVKEQRILIFDESLRIIGESDLGNDVVLKSLFITREGDIYARILPKDENTLHFVRLSYSDNHNEPFQIVKK